MSHHRRGIRTPLGPQRGHVVVSATPATLGSWRTHLRVRGRDVEPSRAHATRGEAWLHAWERSVELAPCLLALHDVDGSVAGVWALDAVGVPCAVACRGLGSVQ